MAPITADEIRHELSESYLEARLEFLHPSNTDDGPEQWTLWLALVGEALYAVDRYRTSSHEGIVSDETDDSIDELADAMATEAMPAVMEFTHALLAKMAAAKLGGRLYRNAQPA